MTISKKFAAAALAALAMGNPAAADVRVDCASASGETRHGAIFHDEGYVSFDLFLPENPFHSLMPRDDLTTAKTQGFAMMMGGTRQAPELQQYHVTPNAGVKAFMIAVTKASGEPVDVIRCVVPQGWAPGAP